MKKEIKKEIYELLLDNLNICDYEIISDGTIIVSATSEENKFYIKYNDIWYTASFDDDITTFDVRQDDFGGEYYDDWYCNHHNIY